MAKIPLIKKGQCTNAFLINVLLCYIISSFNGVCRAGTSAIAVPFDIKYIRIIKDTVKRCQQIVLTCKIFSPCTGLLTSSRRTVLDVLIHSMW
jgi:uncharacterized sodium:solute symporter family permease YidK